MSHTPPLPALAAGTIVIKPPQLPLLQLLLQLQPRSPPGPHVPPTQLLLAPAEGTIALPLLPALVGGIIVLPPLLPFLLHCYHLTPLDVPAISMADLVTLATLSVSILFWKLAMLKDIDKDQRMSHFINK